MKKKIILIDRFSDSTMAYQHYDMGISKSLIKLVNNFLCTLNLHQTQDEIWLTWESLLIAIAKYQDNLHEQRKFTNKDLRKLIKLQGNYLFTLHHLKFTVKPFFKKVYKLNSICRVLAQ